VDHHPEYTQAVAFNSDGFKGDWPPSEKPRSEFRIFTVGDSFTEGLGDPASLGYPGRLARSLARRKSGRHFRVVNAGIRGSDPVFGVEVLQHSVLQYHPDLVTITVNYSDINDIKKRGGFDRFAPDGQLHQQIPWWTPFFNRSHLVRAFVLGVLHYNHWLQSPEEERRRLEPVPGILVEAGVTAKRLADEHGFKLAMLFHPVLPDVLRGRYEPPMEEAKSELLRRGIEVIDLLPDFRSVMSIPRPNEFFWERDGHCTPKGYDIFAKALEKHLVAQHLIGDRD
jgi:lysophospholipase L1-like esterase